MISPRALVSFRCHIGAIIGTRWSHWYWGIIASRYFQQTRKYLNRYVAIHVCGELEYINSIFITLKHLLYIYIIFIICVILKSWVHTETFNSSLTYWFFFAFPYSIFMSSPTVINLTAIAFKIFYSFAQSYNKYKYKSFRTTTAIPTINLR